MNLPSHPLLPHNEPDSADTRDDIEMSRRGAITALIAYFSTSTKTAITKCTKWWKGGNDKPHA